MAELFVSPSVEKLVEKVIEGLFYYVQDQFKWQTGMKKELERLRDNYYPKITAVVSAARRAQTKDQNLALNKWIWKLRDAIDEADDLFDDFEYMKHQQQDNWQKLIKVGERALKTDPILKRLEEVVQKLDNISAEVSIFLHLLENINQEQREQQVELHKIRETGSSPKDDLIGRGKDKESVIEWLRKPSDVTTNALHGNISVLSLVGHGGMGKTTLLQHVYTDEMTKEFNLKMWVCVSDNFDVKKVITDMLECLQNKRPSLESLHALQNSLQSEVRSNKFLLVLDDIWDDKEEEAVLREKWGNVLSPLAYGGLGSKILITTRTDSVASMIAKVIRKKNEAFRLEGLEEDECLQLLTTHAFADVDNPDDHKKLKVIAGELVKKLYGSPLAAKVMGGVLNSRLDESHWRYVLNSSSSHNDIFSILKLSYIFLPEHLQSCFSFCSIFKQDHVFDKDDLVHMWIAVGFIQPSHNNQGEEDIGKRYFDVLIKKSFFVKVSSERYKIHDLLHELAQYVSKQECFRFMGNEKSMFREIPKTIRHLSVETDNLEVLKKVGRFKNLRTLLITCYNQGFVDALSEMLKVNRSVRLLQINNVRPKVIPENIRYLHHLRYFNFVDLNVKLLPRSLSSLYHLQFIISNRHFVKNRSDDYFPRDMNNLTNLRHLSSSSGFDFPGIGKLTLLQELKKFEIKNKNGYRIEELEHMNELRYLGLNNLKDVRDAEEACKAKLCNKRKLMNLFLDWNHSKREIVDRDLDERVLDNLQPHNHLKKLYITNYMGVRSAIWMKEAHTINNLEEIKLDACLEWEIIPPFGQLSFLKTLTLEKMSKVKRLENKFHGNDMRCLFPSLKELHIIGLEALVDWFDANVVDDLFPCLTQLSLSNCPNLQELPYLPPKLETVKIDNIGWKALNFCSISKSIPLETLEVRRCPNITSISLVDEEVKRLQNKFHGNDMCCVFPSLQKLHFDNLEALVDWFDASVVDDLFPSLTILRLFNCPNLQELPYLPHKLVLLEIDNIGWKTLNCCSITKSIPLKVLLVRDCEKITSISPPKAKQLENKFHGNDMFCIFLSLEELYLINLEALVDWFDASVVDGLFPCLTKLYLSNCPKLQELPYLPSKLESLDISNIRWKTLNCCSISNSISLKTLAVRMCENITSISPCVFPLLEKLKFENMEALVDWFDASVVDDLFPCLTKLCLINCPNLQEFPYLPPKLKKLKIDNIGWKTLNCCSISRSIPLETLNVRHCPSITSISLVGEIDRLRKLRFEDLQSLESLSSSLTNISSLEILELVELPLVQEYPDPPPSLKEFYFR